MAYQPLENLLPKSGGSVYKLIRLASKRAGELADNKPNLIDAPLTQKLTTVALREIAQGKVVIKSVSEEFRPKAEKPLTKAEKAKKAEEEEAIGA
jgi:DNA-directed RNA polymerase omega subunit